MASILLEAQNGQCTNVLYSTELWGEGWDTGYGIRSIGRRWLEMRCGHTLDGFRFLVIHGSGELPGWDNLQLPCGVATKT